MSYEKYCPSDLNFPFQRTSDLIPSDSDLKVVKEDSPFRVKLWNERFAWYVTQHKDVKFILSDRSFSNDINHPHMPKLSPGDGKGHEDKVSFLHMDDPRHREIRKAVAGFFTFQAIENLKPYIKNTIERLICDIISKGPEADIIEQLASPLPARVICFILGISENKHSFFEECTRVTLSSSATPKLKKEVSQSLRDYLKEIVDGNIKDPQDNLIGHLITNYLTNQKISYEDVISTVQVLLIGGLETTTNAIGMILIELLRDHKLWERLQNELEMIPHVVEELLRYHTIFDTGLTRVALEDTNLPSGAKILTNEGVIVSLSSANRDPRVFDDPGNINFERKHCPHLAFGSGTHFCIGNILARVEIQMVILSLLQSFPNLRLKKSVGELNFRHDLVIYGPYNLPVTW